MPGKRRRMLTVAREGVRLATLERLRDELAAAIDAGPEPRDLATLARRLESVLGEIDALEEPDGAGDLDDELERRRVERQGGVA